MGPRCQVSFREARIPGLYGHRSYHALILPRTLVGWHDASHGGAVADGFPHAYSDRPPRCALSPAGVQPGQWGCADAPLRIQLVVSAAQRWLFLRVMVVCQIRKLDVAILRLFLHVSVLLLMFLRS